MATIDTSVLVVGAGPVGLSMAIDLAARGINCVIVELRAKDEPPSVKCNHVASRSMELFRRFGLAGDIRAAGLPQDYPNDIVYCTTLTGTEFGRIELPSAEQRLQGAAGYADSWWPTPEPPHRINQIYLEPILFRHAAALPGVSVLDRTEFLDFTQDDAGVTARVRAVVDGTETVIRCQYLVGCDGSRSSVRRQLGIKFVGLGEINRNMSTYIRAPGLLARIPRKPSWMSHAVNTRRAGNVVAIDGRELWLIHCRLKPQELEFDQVDRQHAIRTLLGVEDDFAFEVLAKEDWIARRLVAERFRERRVFICGDAAHIWIPVAGYGMNAGIADATDLSWMLAATLNGWAPEGLLDAYERERHPITDQVSRFVASLGIDLIPKRNMPDAVIDQDGAAGDAARVALGRELCEMNVAQYACAGLNFGYFYADSPIIAYDGGEHPAYSLGTYTPSTVPGCRVPHVWLDDGRSLYDALGLDYTLLRLDPSVPCEGFLAAAEQCGLPVLLLDVSSADKDMYDRKLILVRPDRHVAWRGDRLPADSAGLCAIVRGGPARARARAA